VKQGAKTLEILSNLGQIPARFDIEAIIFAGLLSLQTQCSGEGDHRAVVSAKLQFRVKHFAAALADVSVQALAQQLVCAH